MQWFLRLLVIPCCFLAATHALAAKKAKFVADRSEFVTKAGDQFMLNGNPFYFQGTNFYRLSLIERHAEAEVYDIMRELAASGMKVVRIWGFSCGDSNAQAMLRSVSKTSAVYDEIALRRLDLAIDAARSANLKVIIPLVNYQKEYCPMSWWVNKVIGEDDPNLFYSDPDVREAFKRHVGRMLSRANTAYLSKRGENITYANDPTIMAIELANEPHTEDWYETERDIQPGDLLYNWLSFMSDFIRSVDPNHLIASGEEGYKREPHSQAQVDHHWWLSDGSKGADYERNLTLPNIDFATVHAYPTHWMISTDEIEWFAKEFLADRARIAHKLDKPVVLEEIGISDIENPYLGYTKEPHKWLELLLNGANDAGYNGTMIWQLVPAGSEEGEFIYDFRSPTAAVVFKQAEHMNKKSITK
jgi:mannan endo-1,4-beta-mannosidase